jgi:DNA invertase Pin-like site-specific DNA recombinase
MSGARDDRPGLAALLEYVREGDTVVVWKLDRLGRNTLHILETVKSLTDRGVTLVSTTDGIDSSTAAGRMVIAVLASMAEFERELIKERTALKRVASQANGTRFGRAQEGRGGNSRRHGQADEGGWPHTEGHRQVPRRQPCHALPLSVNGPGCLVRTTSQLHGSSTIATRVHG